MKILHITPAFQHPDVRGPHRHYHFLRELSGRHSVTLLTLIRADVPDPALREVGRFADRVLAFNVNGHAPVPAHGLVGRLPLVGGRFEKEIQLRGGIGAMRRVFRRLVEGRHFDVVLFHGKSVFPVVEGWRGLPMVVDFCDATSMRLRAQLSHSAPAKRLPLWLRYQQVLRLERRLVASTPQLAFIAPRDRAAVLGGSLGARIVPNGVDLDYWRLRAAGAEQPGRLVFSGVMDYRPNHDAACLLIDRILPRVRARLPEAELVVVGRHPLPELVERGRREPGVTVTGAVDDMRPHLAAAALFAAPVPYASGTQNKVLEAMAMGLPVLTSPVVAAGLDLDGTPAPVWAADADDPAAFALRIVAALQDAAGREALGQAGRRFVEARFSWANSATILEEMCRAAIATAGSAEAVA